MEELKKKKLKSVKRIAKVLRSFTMTGSGEEGTEYLENFTEYNRDGHVVKDSRYLDNGNVEEVNSFVYDDQHRLVEHVLEYVPDEAVEKRIVERDTEGRIIRETKYYGDLSGEHTEYIYNSSGEISEIKYFDEEGDFSWREELNYDAKKNLVTRISFEATGTVKQKTDFTFSEDGLTVEEKISDGKGAIEKVIINKYNENKKEESNIEKTGQDKLISAVYSTYDEKGRLVEKRYKDFYSKVMRLAYDDLDHCISEELFDDHGTLLRKHLFEYDTEGQLLTEQNYEMDVTRGGRDKHQHIRYEYEFYE